MHIPDGFLSLPTVTGTAILSAAAIGLTSFAARKTRIALAPSGLTAAFLLSAQSLNVPAATGISGHLIGGALAAILLGPITATLVLTVVLGMQCLLFHDGGITTLGANLLNMALAGVWSGWIAYHLCGGSKRPALAAAVAGWISVMTGALLCSAELLISQTAPSTILLPMLGIHAVIGLFEAGATCVALKLLTQQTHAPAIQPFQPDRNRLAIAILLLILAIPLASQSPDGLEWALKRFSWEPRPLIFSLPWLGWTSRHASSIYFFLIASMTVPMFASTAWAQTLRGRRTASIR